MKTKKELDVMTMTSNPEREKICRKAQKQKNRKEKHLLTAKQLKQMFFNIAEIAIIVTIVLLVA